MIDGKISFVKSIVDISMIPDAEPQKDLDLDFNDDIEDKFKLNDSKLPTIPQHNEFDKMFKNID